MTVAARRLLRGRHGETSVLVRPADDPALPPFLLLHPLNLQGEGWVDVAERLGGRQVVMPDLRAHGRSPAAGPLGSDPWLDDLEALLDELEIDRFHVAGGSFGGGLAVALAGRLGPRVLTATSFGGGLRGGGDLDAVAALIRERGVDGAFAVIVPRDSVAPGTDPALVARAVRLCNPNRGEVVLSVLDAANRSDMRPQARVARADHGTRGALLVVSGEHDATSPPELGERVAAYLDAPHRVLPGVGHLPMLEDPAATAALLLEHAAGHETPTAGSLR